MSETEIEKEISCSGQCQTEQHEYDPKELSELNPDAEVISPTDVSNPSGTDKNAADETKEVDDQLTELPNQISAENPGWSFSQWSEDFESIDEDKPSEDILNDPKMAILWAAERNELETLRKLLDEDSSLVHTRDNDSYTPLHRACYNNHVEVLKILLSYEADINAKTADDWEPLHCACKWDSVEAVSLLLQNGANINATTKGLLTPLHLAASNVSGRRTLELLLWHPYVDAQVKNNAGDTAYDIACRSGPLCKLFEILDESINIY